MPSKNVEDLHPILQPLCDTFLSQCSEAGLDIRLLMTYRTPEEQNKIYAQGRTAPGKIVTSLRGDKSKHCFKLGDLPAAKAFDFGVFDNGKYIGDGNDSRYLEAGKIGEALGLVWGGRWKKPFDPSHLEIV